VAGHGRGRSPKPATMMDDHAPGGVLMATQDMAKNGTFDASDRRERPPNQKENVHS